MPTNNSINVSTAGIVGFNGTAFVETAATNHAVLIGGSTSSTFTNVGPTATVGQVLQSAGAASDPTFSTATYPLTTTINQLLYSGAANTVIGLATTNQSVLTTTTSGVPAWVSVATNGQLIIGSTAGNPAAATLTQGAGVTITNGSNSITIAVNGATVGQTITGDTGGALSPTAGNWNLLGSGSITTAGSGSTLTTQLTGLTNHAVLVGAGTTTITKVGPTATSGQVLQSAGSSADPAFSTATYPATTTINQVLYSSSNNVISGITAANNGTLISGTTGIPSWLANGSTGQLLTATTGSPPSWVSPATATITLTGDSGGALNSSSFTITGGTTGHTFAGSGSTLTLGGVLVLANGGTNANLTASNGGIFYSTATAGAILSGTATAGQIIRSGASAAPTWSTATYPATAGTSGNVLTSDGTNWTSAAASAGTSFNGFLSGSSTPTSPSDATTYYFAPNENIVSVTVSSNTATKFYVTKAVTLNIVYGTIRVGGTLGSAGNSTLFVRVNDTTNTNVTTTLAMSSADNNFNATGLGISLSAGDFFNFGITTPTWVTNPTNVNWAISFSN